jgi:sugar phosphate permease
VATPGGRASFERTRNAIFAIALASYVLSFFHRTAPAAIAGELERAFDIPGAVLGTLAATYFYVYTLMQVPVGVLADTVGPRRLLAGGSLVAGVGALAFALAPSWGVAAAGRTLVGLGVSVAFIAILKLNAAWFEPRRFATFGGVTMFAGNLGAVAAGLPLAWLVTLVSWRMVFVALGLVSLALAAASWWLVRDRPEARGYAPVAQDDDEMAARAGPPQARGAPSGGGAHSALRGDDIDWRRALAVVLGNPLTWPAFVVNIGVGGSFLAFAGLWAVPWLERTQGMTRVAAAEHASLLLLGVAVGALVVGVVSDRLGDRRTVMRVCAVGYALSWLPWLAHVAWPLPATLAWFFAMGLLIPGFTLSWTIAKEVNRPEHSGIATSVVNTGIFLGAGVLQPLVGWTIDRGRLAGDDAAGWSAGIAIMAGAAAFGALASFLVRERTARHSVR